MGVWVFSQIFFYFSRAHFSLFLSILYTTTTILFFFKKKGTLYTYTQNNRKRLYGNDFGQCMGYANRVPPYTLSRLSA